MQGQMTRGEKLFEMFAFLFLLIVTVTKFVIGVADLGVLVIMAFVAFWFYIIMLVCAFVPADWRLLEKQKKAIVDRDAYQTKYRRIMVGVNFFFSILFSVLILVI